MEYKEILAKRCFVVVGDTLNEEKYAYRIKKALLDAGYTVYAVGKELESIKDVPEAFDVLDLCIHPAKGIKLLEDAKDSLPFVLIQPGAGSDEIFEFLQKNNIPYKEGCALVALREAGL